MKEDCGRRMLSLMGGRYFDYVGIFCVWWRPPGNGRNEKDGCKEKSQRGQSVIRLDGETIKEKKEEGAKGKL